MTTKKFKFDESVNSPKLWGGAVLLLGFLACLWCGGLARAAAESVEKPVAVGDGFVVTQKDIDAYREYFEQHHVQLLPKEVVRVVIETQLLSRAFGEQGKSFGGGGVSGPNEKTASVADVLLRAREYQQKLLSDCKVPDIVVESYYRSHPEKYKKDVVGGLIEMKPLDNELSREIRFEIVEAKRQSIVDGFVDRQIAKYHIKIISE